MNTRLSQFFILLLLFIGLAARSPVLLLVAVLLLIVFGSSWLWGRYCLSNVSYARRFGSQRLFCGEETDVWIEVVNAKPLPLPWLKAEDEFPKDMPAQKFQLDYSAKAGRVILANVFSLRWYERVRRHYRLQGTRRGAFDFGPVQVSSGDLFGFRERWRDDDRLDTVLVYPKIVSLEKLGLQAARPFGDFATQRRVVEDPLRLASVRDYQPSDSIRYIHWKATARRGTLQTKVFDPSASQTLLVCLNAQTLDNAYSGVMTEVFETSVAVAASIAYAGLAAHRVVGMYANSGLRDSHHWLSIPASRRSDQLARVLEALAQLTYLTLIPFERLLHVEASHFPYGATIVVVSPVINDMTLEMLANLHTAGHPMALVLIREPSDPPLPDVPTYFVTQNWTELERLELP